jgi:DNA-binding XRE family transcriptional regulator
MNFGNLIRRLRREKNLTLKAVAQETGISYSQLAKIERGVHKPSQETYNTLSKFYNISDFIDGQIKDMRIPVNDPIGAMTRLERLINDAFTCQLCGGKMPEKDIEVHHIIPIFNGGSSEQDNLVTLCYRCHLGRQEFIKEYGLEKDPLRLIEPKNF